MALTDEKYMLLTTFRRSGEGVATPVWLADLGNGEVGFWTSSESGKAKRLRHTARVTVQPCTMRGEPLPGTDAVETTARLITGPEFDTTRRKIIAKYGFMARITTAMPKLVELVRRRRRPYADIGIAVTVPPELR